MNYSEVLTRAWQIIWKHKVLWIFGVLAGCVSGGPGGGSNFRYQQNAPQPLQNAFGNIPPQTWILITVIIVLVILVLVVIGIFLATIGKIGMVRGTLQADKDLEARLGFGELFRGSLPYFWRVFLLNLLVGIALFVLFGAGAILGIFLAVITLGLALLCLLPLLCLLIPFAIAVGVVVEQATIAIVTEDLDIIAGLQRGWEVVRTNPGPFALMWVILDLAIRGIGGLIVSIPVFIAFLPLIISAINSSSNQSIVTGLIISGICFVAYLPFLLVFSGILNSYVQSGWTLTFLRLARPGAGAPEPLPEPLPEPAAPAETPALAESPAPAEPPVSNEPPAPAEPPAPNEPPTPAEPAA
jgi:hypothetical protein